MLRVLTILSTLAQISLCFRSGSNNPVLGTIEIGAAGTEHATAEHEPHVAPTRMKVSTNMRGSFLLQDASQVCDPEKDPNCALERVKILAVLVSLSALILLVISAFSFFREDKEEQITPLCPQLVVKDAELNFVLPALPLFTQADTSTNLDVTDKKDNCVCKISMDWPDPFRGSPHGVAATVRIHKSDMTLATIVARNVAVLGQGLALCRTGCEIFGFVEPEGNKYLVRHRTGIHLLTLVGSFGIDASKNPSGQQDIWDIEGVNPVGAPVCSMKKVGDECVGRVRQHVDAGLVICAIMATYVHRRLSQPLSTSSGRISPSIPSSPAIQDVSAEEEDKRGLLATGVNAEASMTQAADSAGDVTISLDLRDQGALPRSTPVQRDAAISSTAPGETGNPPAAG